MDNVTYTIIPGAGSAGLTWSAVVDALDATMLPVPNADDVESMAQVLVGDVSDAGGPHVLIGASLGAMVALEIAKFVRPTVLVLLATGFGIEVSAKVIEWVRDAPEDLYVNMARASTNDRDDAAQVARIEADFLARTSSTLLQHLLARDAYQPEPMSDPPLTMVLWGEYDRSVPMADHVELARQCRGALVPIRDAGHMPFIEQPDQTVQWLRIAGSLAASLSSAK